MDLNIVIEVKGHISEYDILKKEEFLKQYTDYKYYIIMLNDLKDLCNKYNISMDFKTYEGVIFSNENKKSYKNKIRKENISI